MFEVSDMRSWLMAGSAGTEEMEGALIVLVKSCQEMIP